MFLSYIYFNEDLEMSLIKVPLYNLFLTYWSRDINVQNDLLVSQSKYKKAYNVKLLKSFYGHIIIYMKKVLLFK